MRHKGGGIWYVLVPIRRAPVEGAPMAIMGWAYLEFDVNDAASESTPLGGRMIASLVMLVVLLAGGGVAIWRLATAPVRAVREDLELCLRGHLAEVAVPGHWRQMKDLGRSINRLIVRWKKGEVGGAEPSREAGLDLGALQAMVLDMPVPVFLTGGEGPILEVSQTACAWLGAPREALVGRGIDQVLPDAAFLDTLKAVCARVGAGEAASIVQVSTIGANRVAVRAVAAGPIGVVAVIAVG
ncbi:MAG: PAS domain-containing protein [Pseudomonadota bacterium]